MNLLAYNDKNLDKFIFITFQTAEATKQTNISLFFQLGLPFIFIIVIIAIYCHYLLSMYLI